MRQRYRTRRLFLADLGKGSVGALVLAGGLSACGDDDDQGSSPDPTALSATAVSTGTVGATSEPTQGSPSGTTSPTNTVGPVSGLGLAGTDWHQVPLGFVSAYVLARDGEAAVVDTGVAGGAGDIRLALQGVGLDWDAVGHVILTHMHGDHVGGLSDVMASAPAASAYAGAGDLFGINSPRELTAVGDGDTVFDLEIIETPGHTPGHISVLDSSAGLLVAGDSLNGSGGGVTGPNPQFTPDMDEALRSVAKLAGFEFEVALFGHGDPVLAGASRLVAEL